MKGKLKTFLVWVLLILVFVVLFTVLGERKRPLLQWNTFLRHVEQGHVRSLRVVGNEIKVDLRSGYKYKALGMLGPTITKRLSKDGVKIRRGKASRPMRTLLLYGLPIVLFLVFFVYFLRKFQGGGTASWSTLLKSPARHVSGGTEVTFDDVGGCREAKELFADLVDFLNAPERWEQAGARLPRGVLLEGPPGCGKTLLARALAGETQSQFYVLSASEFVEMFVGVGAARVRDLFETASQNTPAVIFIDEIDAVGRRRGSGLGAGHDEREQTLNQLLVCLDGFELHQRVLVIGATNRPDLLDQALSRPGRFDRSIKIGMPDCAERLEILEIHTRAKTLHEDVDLAHWAKQTEGFHGAMLESLTNEAALHRVRQMRRSEDTETSAAITNDDLKAALALRKKQVQAFDQLDALLVESATQLAEPTARAVARVTLDNGDAFEGDVLWAHSSMLKLRILQEKSEAGEGQEDAAREVLIAKHRITTIEALAGTEEVEADGMRGDIWAHKQPNTA